MTYELLFSPSAEKSWRKLAPQIRSEFCKILLRRLEDPHVPAARLRGYPNLYKVKLRGVGYRLVYHVRDEKVTIYVVGVGRRDEVYQDLRRIGLASFSSSQ